MQAESALLKKRVLIIGLLPIQINTIIKNFSDYLHLSFFQNQNSSRLRKLAQNQHKIFVLRKFIRHSTQGILKAAGAKFVIISGAVSDLRNALTQFTAS